MSGATRPASRLPATVVGLGVVSLFTDVSSEAIFPLVPAFLVSLGASGAFIGLVEGAAELVAAVLKYVTGRVADSRVRLKPLVLAGYAVSTVARPLVALATAPWHVLVVRVSDRIGKGVRTSPRDALIAAVTDPGMRARAFGFHRAMDHAGAAAGTLVCAAILWLLGATEHTPDVQAMRTVFAWAAVPGFVALLALVLTPEPEHAAPVSEGSAPPPLTLSGASPAGARGVEAPLRRALAPPPLTLSGASPAGARGVEAPLRRALAPPPLTLSGASPAGARGVEAPLRRALAPPPLTLSGASPAGARGVEAPLRRALAPLVVFALANATDAFLVVKAARLGASPALAPLLWLVLHLVKASTATPGGRLADRYGRRNALALGWTVYAVLWGAIGFATSLPALFALTAVYGCSHGLVEGAERALVAEYSRAGARGRAYGAYNLLVGVAALVASAGFGKVWDLWGSTAAFVGSASLALLAALMLLVLVPAAAGRAR